MTIQVKPVYRKPEEGQGLPGRVLDKDDTQRLLIKARSSVLHMEAGYTTDNLLLSLTVECLAMREETIYVPPRQCPPLPLARKHRPSGNAAPWKRRAHGPRSDSMKEPPTNSADQPVLAPPQGSRAMRNSGSLSQRA